MELRSLDDTRQLATELSDRLPSGSLLLLVGPMGSGKTTLTELLARALGSQASVSSPTYTLIHEYPTPHGVLIHIDAYRLNSADALVGMGLDDYLERSRMVVVEWGEALASTYPEAWLVRLERNEASRRAEILPPESRAGC